MGAFSFVDIAAVHEGKKSYLSAKTTDIVLPSQSLKRHSAAVHAGKKLPEPKKHQCNIFFILIKDKCIETVYLSSNI